MTKINELIIINNIALSDAFFSYFSQNIIKSPMEVLDA
jgi:hypothetical protein